MPPRIKVRREEILDAAVALIREKGESALNARALAAALHCSTQPIFYNFATMEELAEATYDAAYQSYLAALSREVERGEYPPYKAFGMAYVRFAHEERTLFRYLFLRDRGGLGFSNAPDFEASIKMIMKSNGFSRETAERMHLEMWSCVHGIGTMIATSFLNLEWNLISEMLSDLYQGLRAKHCTRGMSE